MKDEQLEKRIYDLSEQVASGFARTSAKLETMASDIERLQHHIEGNGKPGVRMELDRLKEANERRTKREWWFLGIAASLFVAIIGIVIRAILVI